MSIIKFDVTLTRTYRKVVTIEIDDTKCDDPWKAAQKAANKISWRIEDADNDEDDIEAMDEV